MKYTNLSFLSHPLNSTVASVSHHRSKHNDVHHTSSTMSIWNVYSTHNLLVINQVLLNSRSWDASTMAHLEQSVSSAKAQSGHTYIYIYIYYIHSSFRKLLILCPWLPIDATLLNSFILGSAEQQQPQWQHVRLFDKKKIDL